MAKYEIVLRKSVRKDLDPIPSAMFNVFLMRSPH